MTDNGDPITDPPDDGNYDCPECDLPYYPGQFDVQPMTNGTAEYLARRCPRCEYIHDRLAFAGEFTASVRAELRDDPDPPEGWP